MKPGQLAPFTSLLALFALLLLPIVQSVSAEPNSTFNVSASNDMVDSLPGDGICETQPGNGMCTLRAAIMEANVHIGADIISLPAATYHLTIPGVYEDLDAIGDLDITDSLTITGLGYNDTIIDALGLGARVLDILENAVEVNISGVRIQHGSGGDGGGIRANATLTLSNVYLLHNQAEYWGGAIKSNRLLTLSNVIIEQNSAGTLGGGIQTSSEVVAEDSRFTSNSAEDGGAIYASPTADLVKLVNTNLTLNSAEDGGSIYTFGDLEMEGGMISESDASNTAGGILISGDAKATLMNVSIRENHAVKVGGGIWMAGNGTFTGENLLFDLNSTDVSGGAINNLGGTIHLYRCVLRRNSADNGGAILTHTGSSTTIEESTIISNTASNEGGGIYNKGGLTLAGVTLSENHAHTSGAIRNTSGLTIENSTISQNSSDANGGGISNEGTSFIYNSTITANTAGADLLHPGGLGGGVYTVAAANTQLRNSILSGNHHRQLLNLVDDDCHGVIKSGDYNLFGTFANCNLDNPPGHDLIGVDPLLGNLADNAGSTLTHALLEGSPAVDAANPAGCLGKDDALLTIDQRAVSRPLDGDGDSQARCDIGAFELSHFKYLYLPMTIK